MSEVLSTYQLPAGARLVIVEGDICDQRVDTIVNAANSHLAHGGGVAGAIVRRGGDEIQRQSDTWVREHGPASHDRPALTGAGRLPCLAVIHAVGPIWQGGQYGEDHALATAYRAALRLANEQGFQSVAFPSISTGIFGFPMNRAARIAVQAVAQALGSNEAGAVREVRFVLRGSDAVRAYQSALAELDRPPADKTGREGGTGAGRLLASTGGE